jgi:hypothetical protein
MKKQIYPPVIGSGQQDVPVKMSIGIDTSMTWANKLTPQNYGIGSVIFSDWPGIVCTSNGVDKWFNNGVDVTNEADPTIVFKLAKLVVLKSTNTGAQNTALIQSALNAGGTIRLVGDGVCLVNDTHVIYSNTNITKDLGFTLKQDTGINKKMFCNAALNVAPTTVTLTYTAGNQVSVGWAAHGLVLGDFVSIQNVLPSSFVGVFRVVTVTDANNVIIQLIRKPVSAPIATNFNGTTAGAVIKAKKADVNIKVDLQGLDYNYANNTGTFINAHGAVFAHIENADITLQISGTRKYAGLLAASRNCKVRVDQLDQYSGDLCKIYGPAFNVEINASGLCNDDGFSMQTKEPAAYAAYAETWGDLISVKVTGIVESSTNPFALYLSKDEIADNIVFDTCTAISTAVGGSGVKIWGNISDNNAPIAGTFAITGTNTLTGTGSNLYDDLYIGQNLYVAGALVGTVTIIQSKTVATISGGVNTGAGATITGSPGPTSGQANNISIRNFRSSGRDPQGQVGGSALQVGYCHIKNLEFHGTIENINPAWSGLVLQDNAYVEKVTSKTTMATDVVYTGYYHYINGHVNKLTIDDSEVKNLPGTSGKLVYVDTKALFKELSLSNSYIVNMHDICFIAGNRFRTVINVFNNYVDQSILVYCSSTAGYDLNVGGNVFDNMYNGVTRGGTGTWTASLRSSGNTLIGGSLYSVPITPASYKVWLYGIDIVADLTQHDKTVKGQMAVALANVGTILAGNLVVCDGTNWRQVSDTTLLY